MHSNGYRKISLGGVLAVAGGFLAVDGHASSWCPSSTDYQITCSNCSRELTCDVNGISLEIHGENVTLDGQGYSLNNPPYDGIWISSNGNTIKNLNIWNAGSTGIYFAAGVSSSWDNVERVFVDGSAGTGILHSSWSPLEIDTSWTYNNQYGVVGSFASSTAYTDYLHSSAYGNAFVGYYSGNSGGSWVRSSYFWGNGNVGVEVAYAPGLWVDDNSFSGSNGTGLSVYDGDGTYISNNFGIGNGNYDCIVAASDYTSAYNNSWYSYSGSGCLY